MQCTSTISEVLPLTTVSLLGSKVELTGSVDDAVCASCCDIANLYACAAADIPVEAGMSAIVVSVNSEEDIVVRL